MTALLTEAADEYDDEVEETQVAEAQVDHRQIPTVFNTAG